MMEDGVGPPEMNPAAVPLSIKTDDGTLVLEGDNQQHLLPGIPDVITLFCIVPKLGWRDFPSLAAVSRSWRQAMHAPRVYDAQLPWSV
jgi:hypothetical protein